VDNLEVNIKRHNYNHKMIYSNKKLMTTGQKVTDNRAESH